MATKDMLSLKDAADLAAWEPDPFLLRPLTQEEFVHVFGICKAFWRHDGSPKKPHAELTAGDCSDGYINCRVPLSYPRLCQVFAEHLLLELEGHYTGPVDWVVSSDHAAAVLGYEVARQLGARFEFTQKTISGKQIWDRQVIQPGEVILQVEELMTSTATLKAVRSGIREGNPHPVTFAPIALVLVDRSDVHYLDGTEVVGIFRFDIQKWRPEDCPLCAQGSARVRPGTNWAQLAGS